MAKIAPAIAVLVLISVAWTISPSPFTIGSTSNSPSTSGTSAAPDLAKVTPGTSNGNIMFPTYTSAIWGGSSLGTLSDAGVQEYFTPEGVTQNQVLGDFQTSSTVVPPCSSSVRSQLTLMDEYYYTGVFDAPFQSYGPKYYSGAWETAAIAEYPDLKAYMANGTTWTSTYVRTDDTNLTLAFEQALGGIYTCYGSYPSFAGFMQFAGSGSDRGYYTGENYSPTVYYDLGNTSVIDFATNSTNIPLYAEGGAFQWAYNCNSGTSTNSTVDPVTGYLYKSCVELAAAAKGHAYFVSGTAMSEAGIIQLLNDFHGGAAGGGEITGRITVPLSLQAKSFDAYGLWFQANMYAAFDEALAYQNNLHGTHWAFWQSWDQNFVTDQTSLMQTVSTQGPFPANLDIYYQVPSFLTNQAQDQSSILPYEGGSAGNSKLSSMWFVPYFGDGGLSYQSQMQSTIAGSQQYNEMTGYGTLLNRMLDVGRFYGLGTNNNIVLLGGSQAVPTLNDFFNVTNYFPATLTYPQYKAVVIWGGRANECPALSNIQIDSIKSFVGSGGGLVFISTPGSGYTCRLSTDLTPLQYVFGASYLGAETYSSYSVASSNPTIQPYGSSVVSNGFGTTWNGFSVFSNETSTVTPIITGNYASGTALVMFSNTYGSGRSVLVPANSMNCAATQGQCATQQQGFQGDAEVSVVVNAIAWSLGSSNTPVMSFPTSVGWGAVQSGWGSGPETSLDGGLVYQNGESHAAFTIFGSKGEQPLVWFYSNNTATTTVSLNLNANWLGVNANCMAVSALTWSVVGGCSGGTISLSDISIPPQSWNPIYIINGTSTNLDPLYSNTDLSSYSVGSASATYDLTGPHLFTSWLVVRSSSGVSTVTSSSWGVIPAYGSLNALNRSVVGMSWTGTGWQNSTQGGYFYDSTSHLLYIHFMMGSPTDITVQQSVGTTSTTSTSTSSSTSSSTTSTTTSATTTSSTSSTTTGTAGSPFSFTLSATPSAGSVLQGKSVSTSVSAWTVSGTPQPVSLSAASLPPGVSVLFSPSTATPNFETSMTLSASPSTPPGTYTIPISATSGQLTRTANYTLSVNPNGYNLVISTSSSQGGTTDPSPGTYIYSSATNVTIQAEPSLGWSLSQWVVNGKNSGNGSSITITMTRSASIEAVFAEVTAPSNTATVSITSPIPSASVMVDGKNFTLPSSFDWTLGSSHTISAPSIIKVSGVERALLTGWSGSVSSKSSVLTINVNRTVQVIPAYTNQYLVTLGFSDRNGQPLIPTDVVLTGGNAHTQLSANMSAWLSSGTAYTVTQAYWMDANVALPSQFKVSHSGTYAVPLFVCSDTVKVVDVYGLPISGATVKLAVGNGVTLLRETGANGTVTFSQVPLGTYSGTVSYLDLSTGIRSSTPGNQATTVTLVLSYPVLTSIGLFAVFASIVVYARHRAAKRHDVNLQF